MVHIYSKPVDYLNSRIRTVYAQETKKHKHTLRIPHGVLQFQQTQHQHFHTVRLFTTNIEKKSSHLLIERKYMFISKIQW